MTDKQSLEEYYFPDQEQPLCSLFAIIAKDTSSQQPVSIADFPPLERSQISELARTVDSDIVDRMKQAVEEAGYRKNGERGHTIKDFQDAMGFTKGGNRLYYIYDHLPSMTREEAALFCKLTGYTLADLRLGRRPIADRLSEGEIITPSEFAYAFSRLKEDDKRLLCGMMQRMLRITIDDDGTRRRMYEADHDLEDPWRDERDSIRRIYTTDTMDDISGLPRGTARKQKFLMHYLDKLNLITD